MRREGFLNVMDIFITWSSWNVLILAIYTWS
nr:MAG TPA: hypothetical protein [Caudoviricetes sp.]